MERAPSQVLLRDVSRLAGLPRAEPTRLRRAAADVASFIGANGDDVVFVDNATTGVNAVLRSFPLEPDDEILLTDHTYGATAQGGGVRGAGAASAPARRADPVSAFRRRPAHRRGHAGDRAAHAGCRAGSHLVGERADLAASGARRLLPRPRRCGARGCRSRARHAAARRAVARRRLVRRQPAQVGARAEKLWLPLGRSFAPGRPSSARDFLGTRPGLHAEFDWVGTRDPSAWLAAPAGLAFLHELDFARRAEVQPRSRLARRADRSRHAGTSRYLPPNLTSASW